MSTILKWPVGLRLYRMFGDFTKNEFLFKLYGMKEKSKKKNFFELLADYGCAIYAVYDLCKPLYA